jgi:hypothetical protein
MSTIDGEVVATGPPVDLADSRDIALFLDELQGIATGAEPGLLLGGTFAMYSIPQHEGGGLMLVFDIPDGPMKGIQHNRIPPHLVRAIAALATGHKVDAVKALMGKTPKRKGITSGNA